jgi:2-keto-4-pentenoate hydratase/2-oxohepta-3-ene-1,7-dioic acid hydratase in catechol pathway
VRFATLTHPEHGEAAAIGTTRGYVFVRDVARAAAAAWPEQLDALLEAGALPALQSWVNANRAAVEALTPADARWQPTAPWRHPRKLIGVGLNYAEHAGDLGAARPDEPASFMKPATTIVGPGDTVVVPRQSERTTGEAELGLVIGRRVRNLSEADALTAVAGVVTLIDMTAEDILQRNPRFLTRAKSFDTFFAFGPELVTLDELGDLANLEVATMLNGVVHRKNHVRNMLFNPAHLVAFFSQVMTLEPGDIISTGTPGAAVLADGDTVGCVIEGVGAIACPVRDEKVRRG